MTFLRSIPSELDKKDVFILEGIRYTYRIIQLSYQDLFNNLTIISKSNSKGESIEDYSYYRIFKEAWSVIDFSWKLRNLILQIKVADENEQKSNELAERVLNLDFFNKIRDFRNTFQHLDERISEVIVQENDSVWGSISWIYVISQQKIHSCLLFPGHPRTSSNLVNPSGIKLQPPVCHITLTSINRKKARLKLNISEFMEEMNEFMKEFELIIVEQLNQMNTSETLAQDMILTAEFFVKSSNE